MFVRVVIQFLTYLEMTIMMNLTTMCRRIKITTD